MQFRTIVRYAPLLGLAAGLGCSREPEPDAYGNFEAEEVVVAAEGSGRLLSFTAEEGAKLAAGAVVGLIDTTALALERSHALAQRTATGSRTAEIDRQIAVLEAQVAIAKRAYERTRRLHDQQAATSQQLDQALRDHQVLSRQIAAARAQRGTVSAEVGTADARVAQIDDRLRRTTVISPAGGTVLATYVRAGEVVQPGQALYRMADLDSLELRAYVTGTQLGVLRLGAPAEVSVDVGEDVRRVLPGRVIWIASDAEFTPTPIQTRDERADLVYAVKIRVDNREGIAKIGMPADVRFGAAPE